MKKPIATYELEFYEMCSKFAAQLNNMRQERCIKFFNKFLIKLLFSLVLGSAAEGDLKSVGA